jgi:hypothetical protein
MVYPCRTVVYSSREEKRTRPNICGTLSIEMFKSSSVVTLIHDHVKVGVGGTCRREVADNRIAGFFALCTAVRPLYCTSTLSVLQYSYHTMHLFLSLFSHQKLESWTKKEQSGMWYRSVATLMTAHCYRVYCSILSLTGLCSTLVL